MIKKIILIMVFLISILHAENNPLSKLPFGIELGKKVPKKVEDRATKIKEDKKGNIYYYMENKFEYTVNSKGLVDKLAFYNYYNSHNKTTNILPKIWRQNGIKLSTRKLIGTSLEEFKKNIKLQIRMANLKEYDDDLYTSMNFDVNNKYHFYLKFWKHSEHLELKSGLLFIIITRNVLDDDY